MMYQSIEIEDVGFPNILVTLCGERGWLLFPSASSFPFGMKFCDTQSQECRTFWSVSQWDKPLYTLSLYTDLEETKLFKHNNSYFFMEMNGLGHGRQELLKGINKIYIIWH